MLKYLIAILLIGHGLIVAAQAGGSFGSSGSSIANPAWLGGWPTRLGDSWLLGALKLDGTAVEKAFGLLWVVFGLCLVAAGLGIFGFVVPKEMWQTLAMIGASGSLAMLALYLHPFFIIGITVDVAILVSLIWTKWPAEVFASV